MGLSDRDYMNERRPEVPSWERPPPSSSLRSTLWVILTWVSILFLLYKGFLWWESQKNPLKPLSPSVEIAAPENAPTKSIRTTAPVQNQSIQQSHSARSVPQYSGDRTVTKCVVNDQVIFTDRDCPTGSKASSVTVNTANVGTVAPQESVQPPIQRHQQAVVSNVSTVSGGDNVSVPTRKAECAYLDEQIKIIDALARQPQSGQSQDSLSEQRKRLRSRQFELHC